MTGNMLPRDGEAYLFEAAVPPEAADRMFEMLLATIDWCQEQAVIMGRRLPLPRLTAWHGDAPYVYSGVRHEPAPWSPVLLDLKAIAERCAGQGFDSVLLNFYRDGRDSVSWHADAEPSLGPNPVIASLSLGAVRRFRMKHRSDPAAMLALDLPHGSCLVMAGSTQHHWLHALPKTARPVGPRVNLTFRRLGASPAQSIARSAIKAMP